MAAITQDDMAKIIEIAGKAAPPPHDSNIPENVRSDFMKALAKLKMDFQTPVEATIELASGDTRHAMVRLAIDLGIFNAIAGGRELNLSDIAASSKASPQLIARLLRFLSTMGLFKKVKADTWAPHPLLNVWVDGSPLRDILVHFQSAGVATAKLPLYLQQTKYQEPDNYFDGPFTNAYGNGFWEWLKEDKERHSTFNRFMVKTRLDTQEEWYDFYPVERLGEGDPSRPLLVDIGGGLGHDVAKFNKSNPQLKGKGKLILQDLPEVIEEAKAIAKTSPEYEGIEAIPYDFFTSQPIKDARTYYLRTVLHDWPDQSALRILENVRKAMPPDARLLINENMLSEEEAPFFAVWMDITMMVSFSAWERTNKQWLKLFDDAGFELLKQWEPSQVTVGGGVLFELKPKGN